MKKNPKTQAFFQLLAKKKNKDILCTQREKAGLPLYGIDWNKGGIDLSKYDIQALMRHYGAYRALLVHHNQAYSDIFLSQDLSLDNFLFDYFIFNQVRENNVEKINLSGCEIITIPELTSLPNEAYLFKGVYLKIGTNNTIKNVKDFIKSNSQKILNAQRKLATEKPIRLKPSKFYLRDNFIYQFSKHSIKTLLALAEKDGILPEVQKRLNGKKFEKKEVILQVYIEKLFKQKLSIGAIRKSFLGK